MSADQTALQVLAAHERETTTDARELGRSYPHDRKVFVIDCACGAEFEVEVLDTDACELDALRRGCATHTLAALSAARVACVELPKLTTDTYGREAYLVPTADADYPGRVFVEPRGRIAWLSIGMPVRHESIRPFAAALLAAGVDGGRA